jgi:hypothetical protein
MKILTLCVDAFEFLCQFEINGSGFCHFQRSAMDKYTHYSGWYSIVEHVYWIVILSTALSAFPASAAELPALHRELGVHNDPGCSSRASNGVDNVEKFSQWLGRRPDRILDFTWHTSWSEMVRSTGFLTKCWHDAGYTNLTYSIGMLPQNDASLAQGA